MSSAIRIRRKNAFNLFREAKKLGNFDEFPMLRPEVDPQLHASRNSVDQPFYLTTEKDCVIAQVSGAARVEYVDSSVRYFDLEPGDYAYVPAGTEHRVTVGREGIQLRYKAMSPGSETVTFRCNSCGGALHQHSFDGSGGPVQAGYQQGTEAFNGDAGLRTCKSCGTEHPPVDLSLFRWNAVLEAINSQDGDED